MGGECLPARKGSEIRKTYSKEINSSSPVTNTMKIVLQTWLLDRSKLFDQQDADNLSVTNHWIRETRTLAKKYNKDASVFVQRVIEDEQSEQCQFDLTFKKAEDGFIISNNGKKEGEPWERVFERWATIKNEGSFKAGSTIYTLKKVVADEHYLQNQHRSQQIESMAQFGENQCRICLDSDYSVNNPLISPCQCGGSVKFLHVRCLKQWLISSENRTDDYLSIDMKKSKCEICKATLLDSVAYQSIIGTILSGDNQIPTPFAVFEGKHVDKAQNEFKNYFIYSFKNKDTFSIGRGKNAIMRSDIDRTVSRRHAQVTLKKGSIMVRDCGSKFGTTKKIHFPIFFPYGKEVKKMLIGCTSITIFFEREKFQRNNKENQPLEADNYAEIEIKSLPLKKRSLFDSQNDIF